MEFSNILILIWLWISGLITSCTQLTIHSCKIERVLDWIAIYNIKYWWFWLLNTFYLYQLHTYFWDSIQIIFYPLKSKHFMLSWSAVYISVIHIRHINLWVSTDHINNILTSPFQCLVYITFINRCLKSRNHDSY